MTDSNDDFADATISWDSTRVVFTQTPDWIVTNPDINDAAFRTWVMIAKFADNKNHRAFPSARKLMELRGKGRRIIFEHIRQLEAAGVLKREARYRPNGGRTSSHYTLAWAHPLTPVQETAPAPHAENRTGPGATERAAPHAENRAPRTTTKNELDPLPPHVTGDADRGGQHVTQGAGAPRTPRSRNGTRNAKTNPRSVQARSTKETQMRRWAHTMRPVLDHDEFTELVHGEVRSDKITAEAGQVAIDESAQIDADSETHVAR